MKISDSEFVSGRFLNLVFPKEKQYLLKYFKTDIQRQFVRYAYVFGNGFEIKKHFTDHTGIRCCDRLIEYLVNKYWKLENAWHKAKEEMNFELLMDIERGKFDVRR